MSTGHIQVSKQKDKVWQEGTTEPAPVPALALGAEQEEKELANEAAVDVSSIMSQSVKDSVKEIEVTVGNIE